jgi:hypothetical protein
MSIRGCSRLSQGRETATTQTAGAIVRVAAVALTTWLFGIPGWAAGDQSCARFALHELLPGMSPDMVRRTMGSDGVKILIHVPDAGQTSGVDYPAASSDVYVEYDRRIDRSLRRALSSCGFRFRSHRQPSKR